MPHFATFQFFIAPWAFSGSVWWEDPKNAKKFWFGWCFGVPQGPWKVIVLGAYSSHWIIPSEANFTHLNEDVWGSSHHKTNQHIWFDQFGHKNHQIWSIGAEITAIFHFQTTGYILAQGFSRFFAIFTLIVNARTLLVIMVCIYTCESMILATKIIKIGRLGQKLWPFFISRLLEKFSIWVFHSFLPFSPSLSMPEHFWSSWYASTHVKAWY